MTNEELSRSSVARTLGVDLEARPGTVRWRGRLLWGIGVVLVAAVALAWSRADSGSAAPYRTLPAERGELRVTVTATGTLEPTNTVEVGSEVSGTLVQVLVDEDDHVKAGQVLARIDPTKIEAQARQLEAALASAEAKVLQAKATREESAAQLRRLEQLFADALTSQQDLDAQRATAERAAADEASAQAAVAQARASLQTVRTDLAKAVIHSPIDGVVLTRTAEPGATVAAQFQAPVLFKIAEDLRRMELRVDVDEADVAQVRAGADATFTVDAYPGRTFQARIKRVRQASQTTDGVVTYEAVLEVDNSTLELRPGMTATAELTASRIEDAVLVPNAALRFTPPAATAPATDNRSFVSRLMPGPPRRRPGNGDGNDAAADNGKAQRVWVLKEGRPSAVPIEIGATDGKRTQVVSGDVTPGLALIVDGAGKE
jgi:HlyD family secretion protein